MIPVMLGVSIITFALINLAPGDPAELMLRAEGMEPTKEAVEALREELGLNAPVHVRYCRWMWGVLHLDMGKSYRTGRPVTAEILDRFPATLELTIAALSFVLLFAVPLGILAALYRHAFIDHLSRILALLGASLPGFWLGLLLIYFFFCKIRYFPSNGEGHSQSPGTAGSDFRFCYGCHLCQTAQGQHAGCVGTGLYQSCPGKRTAGEMGNRAPCLKKCCSPRSHHVWNKSRESAGWRCDR